MIVMLTSMTPPWHDEGPRDYKIDLPVEIYVHKKICRLIMIHTTIGEYACYRISNGDKKLCVNIFLYIDAGGKENIIMDMGLDSCPKRFARTYPLTDTDQINKDLFTIVVPRMNKMTAKWKKVKT